MASRILKYCIKDKNTVRFTEKVTGRFFKKNVLTDTVTGETFVGRECSLEDLRVSTDIYYYRDNSDNRVISHDTAALEEYISNEKKRARFWLCFWVLWAIYWFYMAYRRDQQDREKLTKHRKRNTNGVY